MSSKILIIGGVAAGMSAATRARRLNEEASITVLERGCCISFANCGLPYHIAGRIEREADLLLATPEKMGKRFNIDARTGVEATSIDRVNKRVTAVETATGKQLVFDYDKLILAMGASAIVPPIEHVRAANVFLLRSMEDTRRVQAFLKDRSPRRATVVGAGFIGLEMAEALKDRGMEVSVVEKARHALPPVDADLAPAIEAELRQHGVQLHCGAGLKSLRASEEGLVNQVELDDGRRIDTDMVLLSIGVRPNVELARAAGLAIGGSGALSVDEHQRTSDRDIYAVGDVSEVINGVSGKPGRTPLAGPANRLGRLAGEHAATGSGPRSAPALGTAIVQVFGLQVGMTGLGEQAARGAGFDADSAVVYPADHATYYPGSRPLRIKVIYDRPSGRVLGAQAVGGAGVDKRIDVLASVLHFKGRLDDLRDLDLAYAPQFGSAKDPVHQAAMTALNQHDGVMPAIDADAVAEQQLVDVRTPEEFARGTLAGAVNIPLDELRSRLNELDRARETVVFCQVGQRGYVAQRILLQSGFVAVHNLKGGYSLAGPLMRNGPASLATAS